MSTEPKRNDDQKRNDRPRILVREHVMPTSPREDRERERKRLLEEPETGSADANSTDFADSMNDSIDALREQVAAAESAFLSRYRFVHASVDIPSAPPPSLLPYKYNNLPDYESVVAANASACEPMYTVRSSKVNGRWGIFVKRHSHSQQGKLTGEISIHDIPLEMLVQAPLFIRSLTVEARAKHQVFTGSLFGARKELEALVKELRSEDEL